MTTKEKIAQRRAEIAANQKGAKSKELTYVMKAGKHKMRLVPVPEDETWFIDAQRVYLNGNYYVTGLKGGDKSPFALMNQHLKSSDEEDDIRMAKDFLEREVNYIFSYIYDESGKRLAFTTPKFVPVSQGIFASLLDYAGGDEWGDPSDRDEGYDFTITRVGSTKNDTEYSMLVSKPSKLSKDVLGNLYGKSYDLQVLFEPLITSYGEALEAIKTYFKFDSIEELIETYPFLEKKEKAKKKKVAEPTDEEEAPKPKKKKKIVR